MKSLHETENGGIPALIDALYSEDGLEREYSRLTLISLGKRSTPFLIRALESHNEHARWEAIEALRYIADPAAAGMLVEALKDDRVGTRWAAMNALIALRQAALRPLLIGLTRDFDSVLLRDGARHVLHVFHDMWILNSLEEKVYKALHGPAQDMTVPWVAKTALEFIDKNSSGKSDIQQNFSFSTSNRGNTH